jgi:hypothetical protein
MKYFNDTIGHEHATFRLAAQCLDQQRHRKAFISLPP